MQERNIVEGINAPNLYVASTYLQEIWVNLSFSSRFIVTVAIDYKPNNPLTISPSRVQLHLQSDNGRLSALKSWEGTLFGYRSWIGLWLISLLIIVHNGSSYFNVFFKYYAAPFWGCCSTSSCRPHFSSISFVIFRCWCVIRQIISRSTTIGCCLSTDVTLHDQTMGVSSIFWLTEYFLVHVPIHKGGRGNDHPLSILLELLGNCLELPTHKNGWMRRTAPSRVSWGQVLPLGGKPVMSFWGHSTAFWSFQVSKEVVAAIVQF